MKVDDCYFCWEFFLLNFIEFGEKMDKGYCHCCNSLTLYKLVFLYYFIYSIQEDCGLWNVNIKMYNIIIYVWVY